MYRPNSSNKILTNEFYSIYATMLVRAGTMVVVKLNGPPLLCKTDEVGELCLSSNFTGTGYWGLPGRSSSSFKVQF